MPKNVVPKVKVELAQGHPPTGFEWGWSTISSVIDPRRGSVDSLLITTKQTLACTKNNSYMWVHATLL